MKKEYKKLIQEAKEALKNAYAPYSKFRVGAAVLTKKGNIYRGCNVENSSYALTICAERNALANAIANGERDLEAIAIVAEGKKLRTPCGACRQAIIEFSKDVLVIIGNLKGKKEVRSIKELLPMPFSTAEK
ncbi:MAG: cytidine deaminase [Candidatus Thermoplasmatota archaeon]|nr:cytidine deaminase [Candidatus Thermoplasmatota archaeon]MDI6887118.1 cytidine deaminase [Candidatus Thermoplasmatota archaeon]